MEKKKLTLTELVGTAPEESTKTAGKARVQEKGPVKEVDMTSFIKKKPKISPQDKAKVELLDLVDKNIERTKDDMMKNVIEPFKEACIAASLTDEADSASPTGDLEKELEEIGDHNSLSREDDDLSGLLNTEDSNETEFVEPVMNSEMDISNNEDFEEEEEVEEMTTTNDKPDTFMEDPEETVVNPVESPKASKEEAVPVVAKEVKDDIVKVPTEVVSAIKDSSVKTHQESISDEDFQEFLEEDSSELTEDEKEDLKLRHNEFRKEVYDKLKIDAQSSTKKISGFKISSKPVSINKVLKSVSSSINTATWPLPNSGRLVTFSALSGEEIENLNPDSHEDMSGDMSNRLIFSTIFSHLIDANKPKTMEEWLKTINWFDINDIYFAIYLATFRNSNFITYTCSKDKCNNIFLKEVKYQEMIKYVDKESEELYNKLLKSGVDVTPESISEDVIPINDKYAIGFRAPSVFDIIFGASSLDKSFRTKYATTIGNISYMSNIYFINNDTLFPIDCKPVKDNPSKTMRNKIVAYYNILKTLSSDKYSMVTRSINEINVKNKNMATFHYPDSVCTKCGTEIKRSEEDINPLVMLFIRHQLVQFANSTIE